MAEQTPLTVLNFDSFRERRDQGLLIPLHEGDGLKVVDCADDRNLTDETYEQRLQRFDHHVVPGRLFGAASGYALGGLLTLAAQLDERQLAAFVNDYSAEAFVDLAADISDRAHSRWDQDIVQHSGVANEENPVGLANYKECPNPLGCAFALNCGLVAINSGNERVILEAERVQDSVGVDKPLRDIQRGALVLSKYLPEGFGVHRGALAHAVKRSGQHTPLAIVDGYHAPNNRAMVDIDFAGLRSDAAAHNALGIPRYHHTPVLIAEQLPQIMPEFKLDPDLLYAAGIVLGSATRLALSGAENPHELELGVIPAEYADAA